MKTIKPTLIQCMKCKHFIGLHELLTKVKCNFKPTSDDMRYRTIEDKKEQVTIQKFTLN